MCQAYEAEYNAICAGERIWTIEGFKAFFSRAERPSWYSERKYDYDSRAWEHGWNCAAKGILPHAVEQELARPRYAYQMNEWTCPICGLVVPKYGNETDHKFGFPCDGSDPLKHKAEQDYWAKLPLVTV